MSSMSEQEHDATLARLKFGMHELEHGVGQNIPEPLRSMLGALVGWRVREIERESDERDVEDRIIDVQVRHVEDD